MAPPPKRKAGKFLCSPSLLVTFLQILFFLVLFLLAVYFFDTSYWFRRTQSNHPTTGQNLLRATRFEALCQFLPQQEDAESKLLPYLQWPWLSRNLSLPQNHFSKELQERNSLPPRNQHLFKLPDDYFIFVLYVHNRPQYLRLVVDGLSKVDGIGEVLLIVSHDGFYEEMNSIVEGIRFCQVKQIFAPYSPHLFNASFPGVSPGDCLKKDDVDCKGDADQYGNYRAPHIVSLKHHWWWMMNTVWDGLQETRDYTDHMVFIEEDHYLFPNAYKNIRLLTALKACKCPDCYAANLAPADVRSKGELNHKLVAEKIGNIGYAFNRTIWRKIHASAKDFCQFDEYNWDITMWSAVYPLWGDSIYTLRGPRASAVHFGKCGLHQGQESGDASCFDDRGNLPAVEEQDKVTNIKPDWEVRRHPIRGYNRGFKGWGGWGDSRDHKLCLDFASMYHMALHTNTNWFQSSWKSYTGA